MRFSLGFVLPMSDYVIILENTPHKDSIPEAVSKKCSNKSVL